VKPLILRPGSVLLRSLDQSAQEGKTHEDITQRAVEFLFAPLELDTNVTVGDLFGLFAACPELLVVYRRFYAQAFCDYAAQGPLSAEDGNALDRVEIYRAWEFDYKTDTYTDMAMLSVSAFGLCPAGKEQELGPDEDGFVRYCLDGADLRQLLNVPLRFNPQVKVYDAENFRNPVRTVNCAEFSLGEVLQTVMWSLSWFEGPAQAQETFEHFDKMDKNPEAWEEVSFEELMEEQFGEEDRCGCAALFDSTGDCEPMEVSSAIDNIPDQDNAQQWLQQHVDENISVKPAYRGLDGRDFRQAFLDALQTA
jgi:hypothetical protein